MNGKPKNDVEQLLRLADALVEDIMNASDEEIMNELKDEGDDLAQSAAATRALFDKAAIVAAKGKLLDAKAAVAANRQRSVAILKLDPTKVRERLRRIIANDPEEFTMAARKGDVLSDEDVRGIIEDLVELGLIDDDGSAKK